MSRYASRVSSRKNSHSGDSFSTQPHPFKIKVSPKCIEAHLLNPAVCLDAFRYLANFALFLAVLEAVWTYSYEPATI